jgi:hypothetical protein
MDDHSVKFDHGLVVGSRKQAVPKKDNLLKAPVTSPKQGRHKLVAKAMFHCVETDVAKDVLKRQWQIPCRNKLLEILKGRRNHRGRASV